MLLKFANDVAYYAIIFSVGIIMITVIFFLFFLGNDMDMSEPAPGPGSYTLGGGVGSKGKGNHKANCIIRHFIIFSSYGHIHSANFPLK